MDRQHCIITARKGEGDNGAWNYVLTDNDSRVGTFLFGRILEPKEQVNLSDGDIITLGATTLIFAEEGSDGGEGEQEKNE